jgi:hypothetical protein
MTMEWEHVQSEVAREVGYDDETQEMGVRYHTSSKTSIYGSAGYPVPRDIYEAVKIGSVGRNLRNLIRDQYPHRYL